jgi:hypothetical protein
MAIVKALVTAAIVMSFPENHSNGWNWMKYGTKTSKKEMISTDIWALRLLKNADIHVHLRSRAAC